MSFKTCSQILLERTEGQKLKRLYKIIYPHVDKIKNDLFSGKTPRLNLDELNTAGAEAAEEMRGLQANNNNTFFTQSVAVLSSKDSNDVTMYDQENSDPQSQSQSQFK